MKKIVGVRELNNMYFNKLIELIVNEQGEDKLCDYCEYSHDCSGNIRPDGQGNPIYPPCADTRPEWWFDLDSYIENEGGDSVMIKIKKVIYNDPATIVEFADGEKVVVKVHNEPFDKEKGVAMAIVRKLYGRSVFTRIIDNGVDQKIVAEVE